MHVAFAQRHEVEFATFAGGWVAGRSYLFRVYAGQLAGGADAASLVRTPVETGNQAGEAFSAHRGRAGAHLEVSEASAFDEWSAGWSAGISDLQAEQRAMLEAGTDPELLVRGVVVHEVGG